MDSHQFCGLTAADFYFESPSPTTYTERAFDSPLSSAFECGSLSMLSSSQEQYSSTEIISGSSTDYSPLDTESTFSQSQVHLPGGIQLQSDSLSAVSSHSMRDAFQNVQTVLMEPDTAELTNSTDPEFIENKPRLLTKQRSRTWNHETRLESPASVQSHYLPVAMHSPKHETHSEKRPRYARIMPDSNVKQLLVQCAQALSENNLKDYELLTEKIRNAVSITGEPNQRLGAYMLEGLVARRESSGTNIYRGLRHHQPESKELLSYMQILYDICPCFKFGYMAANGAIADALKYEDRIHIVDFQIAQGAQWITLIQALAARPGGPPHVRITGINDPVADYARGGDGLQSVRNMLSAMSKKFDVPLEFRGITAYGPQVTREMLDIRPGEALAVNFTFQLHHTPDESVDVNNPRDGLLRMVKGLSPSVMTLVEQESNTNTTPFFPRFLETLDYYSATFESMDVTVGRDRKDRINVEEHCLAKDIVNIIACEGEDRVERHELLGKWRSRLSMAGFRPYPLISSVNSVIRTLLSNYSDKYTMAEKDGALLLGWKNRNLISASAWH